jgi:omega-amidase
MKIALISLNQFWEDKESNWSSCKKYIESAAARDVELIIFPEMTLTGFSTDVQKNGEDRSSSQTIKKFSKVANRHNIAIIFGMTVRNEDKYFNDSIFISSDGCVIGEYSKIHPFTFAGEEKYLSSGGKLEIVQYKGMNIGLSVCYDLRFPEVYSAMAQDSDLIINIANWPKKRHDHWNTLIKARAIENQIFIIGVNRTGIDGNGLEYMESSCIYNADGKLLFPNTTGNMHIYEVDRKWQESYRNSFNTVNDRKQELYRRIV